MNKTADDVLVMEPEVGEPAKLTLYDDPNITDLQVVEALMDICKHGREQAIQCAEIIDLKGSYIVKKGEVGKLLLMKDEFLNRGIEASVSTKAEA